MFCSILLYVKIYSDTQNNQWSLVSGYFYLETHVKCLFKRLCSNLPCTPLYICILPSASNKVRFPLNTCMLGYIEADLRLAVVLHTLLCMLYTSTILLLNVNLNKHLITDLISVEMPSFKLIQLTGPQKTVLKFVLKEAETPKQSCVVPFS